MKIYLWNAVALKTTTETKDFISTTTSHAFTSSGINIARDADSLRGKLLREMEAEHPTAKIKIDVCEMSDDAKKELRRWLNDNP